MLDGPRALPALLRDLEERCEACPDDLSLLLKLGRLHARNGSWIEAARTYRRLISADPQNIYGLIEMGVSLSRLGRFDEARFHLERAQEVAPNSPTVYMAFAAWHEASDDPEGQVAFLQRAAAAADACITKPTATAADQTADAVSLAKGRPEIRLKLADVLRRHGDFAGAIAQYRELLRASPHLETARFALATLLIKRDDLNEAIEHLRAIVSINPSAHDAHLNLALCLYRQKKYQLAVPSFLWALKGLKNHPQAQFLLARCYERLNEVDRALVLLEKLFDERPDSIEIGCVLGDLFERSGEPESARDVFARLAGRHPNRPDLAIRNAEFLLRGKRFQAAADLLNALFVRHPGHIEGHRLLADVYTKWGKIKEALSEYKKTLLVNESYYPGWIGAASIYRQMDDPREEYRCLQKASVMEPDDIDTLFRLGELERRLKLPASLERFRRVVQLSPDSDRGNEAAYFIRHA
ncbi:MAG: tetratricopeptide repeat protein [Candidatus Riflebacteria bacterium]|nr:tetratricopeptide repeat protein [Candidatus Riflebacteria bacterium]